MNPLRVDLRAGTFAADPLFQTLGKRRIRQLLAPTSVSFTHLDVYKRQGHGPYHQYFAGSHAD